MTFNKLFGTLCLLLGIGLFSTIEISQKFIVMSCGQTLDPNLLVFVRFIVTGVVLLCIGLPRYFRQGNYMHLKDLLCFFLNGAIGFTICLSLFHYGIDQFKNASSAAVVFSANAVFAVIFARFINHESWNKWKWASILVGLLGISMFMFESGAPTADTFRALGVMCLSAMLFGLSVCFTKRTITTCGPLVYMGGSAMFGGLLSLPLFFLLSDQSFSEALAPMGKAVWSMLYFVFIATALAYWLYYTGIAHTTAFQASMAFMLKPVLACFFAYIALSADWVTSESRMNGATIFGTFLILVAMCLAQYCVHKAEKEEEKSKGKRAQAKKNGTEEQAADTQEEEEHAQVQEAAPQDQPDMAAQAEASAVEDEPQPAVKEDSDSPREDDSSVRMDPLSWQKDSLAAPSTSRSPEDTAGHDR